MTLHIKKTLDNWLLFYLSERRVLAEVAGCKSYFELTEQEISSFERDEYSKFMLVFQMQFGTYEAEHFRCEKEKHHLNEWFSR